MVGECLVAVAGRLALAQESDRLQAYFGETQRALAQGGAEAEPETFSSKATQLLA